MNQSINVVESTKDNTKCNVKEDKSTTLNKNSFEFNYIIGKGGFGKVWRVKYKKTNEIYALKEMSKRKIIDKKSEKSINNERIFLSKLHHPFLVNMHYAFQDQDNLYLVIDILNGGDLRYHCSRYRKFSEEQTRFFIACMVHALTYIHNNNVIHRDIKPENLVLDDGGYLHITDFGIAKENCEDNSSETSGTPGYMSPEVMRGLGHSFSVDFFAVGVIGYEFMIGKRPYTGKNRKEIKEQMFSYQAKIKREEIAKGWSSDSRDFINKLLRRKPELRLGSRDGIQELKEHLWLKYYPWKELEKKTLPGPFIPEKKENFDRRYCEGIDKISENTKLRYEKICSSENYKLAFSNFYYNKEEIKISIDNKKINNNKENKQKECDCEKDSTSGKCSALDITIFSSPNNKNQIDKNKSSSIKNSIIKEGSNENNDNENKNNNNAGFNFLQQYQKQSVNNNNYKKLNPRPFTSKNKVIKDRFRKSASQQLNEGAKLQEKSLYILLNSNSGFISVKNQSQLNEYKDKIQNNKLNKRKLNNEFNQNKSFNHISLLKRDMNMNCHNIRSHKMLKPYSNLDKTTSIEKQILKEDSNQKSFSYLHHNDHSCYFSYKNFSGRYTGSLKFSKASKSILYNRINQKNPNNNMIAGVSIKKGNKLIGYNRRNNSFFLNKRNNGIDLRTIKLYNLKQNIALNNKNKNISYKLKYSNVNQNISLRKQNDKIPNINFKDNDKDKSRSDFFNKSDKLYTNKNTKFISSVGKNRENSKKKIKFQ